MVFVRVKTAVMGRFSMVVMFKSSWRITEGEYTMAALR